MEVAAMMGAAGLLRKCLQPGGGSGLLAEVVKVAAKLLMDAKAGLLCGAGCGERSKSRLSSRDGHRPRRRDTRAGVITLGILKRRTGSYVPGLPGPCR